MAGVGNDAKVTYVLDFLDCKICVRRHARLLGLDINNDQ